MRSLARSILPTRFRAILAVLTVALAAAPLGLTAFTSSFTAARTAVVAHVTTAPALARSTSNNAAASRSTSTSTSSGALFVLNSQWSTTAQNARLSAINTAAASGFLDFYSGTQPANANSAVTGTQLCSIALGATPFTTPASGSMSNAATVSCTGTAGATGTGTAAGYVVLYKTDHTTVLWMGSVGTSAANVTLPSTTITTGETVSIATNAFTITDNASISGQ